MSDVSVKQYLIKQICDYDVLTQDGEFELSSGLKTTYYYEFEKFNDGRSLSNIGFAFLKSAKDLNLEYEVIYGTAYKGAFIALAMTSYAWERDFLGTRTNKVIPVCIERKESKDRNHKGVLVGASIKGKRILLVDDVGTTFASLTRSLDIILNHDVQHVDILIGVNRSKENTLRGLPVNAIATHEEVLANMYKYK